MKIDGKSGTRTEIPFSEPVMDFLSALSERIKSDDLLRSDEEIRAFGFWCRRANLERYRNQYTGNDFRLGRGLVFHIAPSNIPAMFAWSMAIGLLAGNSNIIRISSRTAGQGMRLKELIGQMLSEEKKSSLAGLSQGGIYDMVRFVSYGSSSREQTAYYSSLCDVRVIWGGDRTVDEVRQIPLRADAYDIIFPDRSSLLLLNTDRISELEEDELQALAHRFYMDTYSVDQNACSSPSSVIWHDEGGQWAEKEGVRKRWWAAVEQAAAAYQLTPSRAYRKFQALCEAALNDTSLCEAVRYGNRLWVVPVQKTKELAKRKGSFGTFYEYGIKELEELIPAVNKKIQTMTCQKGQHFIQHKPSSSEGYFSASLEKALFFGPFSTFSFSWFWKQGSHICGNISILAMAAALSAYADTL